MKTKEALPLLEHIKVLTEALKSARSLIQEKCPDASEVLEQTAQALNFSNELPAAEIDSETSRFRWVQEFDREFPEFESEEPAPHGTVLHPLYQQLRDKYLKLFWLAGGDKPEDIKDRIFAKTITSLNTLLSLDPAAIQLVLTTAVPCAQDVEKGPAVIRAIPIVRGGRPGLVPAVSAMGILNGLLEVALGRRIAYRQYCTGPSAGAIIEFTEYESDVKAS